MGKLFDLAQVRREKAMRATLMGEILTPTDIAGMSDEAVRITVRDDADYRNWWDLIDHVALVLAFRFPKRQLKDEVELGIEMRFGGIAGLPDSLRTPVEGFLNDVISEEVGFMHEVLEEEKGMYILGEAAVEGYGLGDVADLSLEEFDILWRARFERYGLDRSPVIPDI